MAEETVVIDSPDDDDDDSGIEWAYIGASPEVIAELLELHQNGKLDPESVAQRAQDPGSALHPIIFKEDDPTAAWRRRVDLARHLVQRVRVVPIRVTIQEGSVKEVRVKSGRPARAFFSVKNHGQFQYHLTSEALAERHDYVVATLDREVRAMVERRRSILSLDEIEDVIKKTIEEIRRDEEG